MAKVVKFFLAENKDLFILVDTMAVDDLDTIFDDLVMQRTRPSPDMLLTYLPIICRFHQHND